MYTLVRNTIFNLKMHFCRVAMATAAINFERYVSRAFYQKRLRVYSGIDIYSRTNGFQVMD